MSDPRGTLTIRSAELRDEAVLLEWRNDPAAHRWFHDPEPVAADRHAQWLRSRLADDPVTLWIAEVDGRPVGTVRLDLGDAAIATVSVSVDPASRGKGFGRQLLRWADTQAATLGCTTVIAEVHAQNDASHALFLSAGYEPVPSDGFPQYRKAIDCRR